MESAPPDPTVEDRRAGWWAEHWRSAVIVIAIFAAMAWALKPKSRPTVELPPFEQTEKRVPEK